MNLLPCLVSPLLSITLQTDRALPQRMVCVCHVAAAAAAAAAAAVAAFTPTTESSQQSQASWVTPLHDAKFHIWAIFGPLLFLGCKTHEKGDSSEHRLHFLLRGDSLHFQFLSISTSRSRGRGPLLLARCLCNSLPLAGAASKQSGARSSLVRFGFSSKLCSLCTEELEVGHWQEISKAPMRSRSLKEGALIFWMPCQRCCTAAAPCNFFIICASLLSAPLSTSVISMQTNRGRRVWTCFITSFGLASNSGATPLSWPLEQRRAHSLLQMRHRSLHIHLHLGSRRQASTCCVSATWAPPSAKYLRMFSSTTKCGSLLSNVFSCNFSVASALDIVAAWRRRRGFREARANVFEAAGARVSEETQTPHHHVSYHFWGFLKKAQAQDRFSP